MARANACDLSWNAERESGNDLNEFKPSPQQQKIFDFIQHGEGNAIVDAKAGSGKTTTIVKGMHYIPQTGLLSPRAVFLAFNKSIATTLQQRIPRGYLSSTFHALGFRALRESGIVESRVKVDGAKCRKILYNIMDYNDEDFRNVLRLIGLLKQSVYDVSYEDIDPRDLIEFHGLDFINPVKSIHSALTVLKKSTETLDVIDFDDMLYLAVHLNARFDPVDWLFVDEAQDTNEIQVEIMSRLQKPLGTRIIAVGDPHQAIYGFRVADSNAMSNLARRFFAVTLPLSVSYRCPKAVVREAQKFLQDEN